ncbi:NUDIX hydrolase domain-like protein [Baffinella frigidus]|nr:NUDIX hydrolase domain-like protein [Cryptophyta sp. CCMP2293]
MRIPTQQRLLILMVACGFLILFARCSGGLRGGGEGNIPPQWLLDAGKRKGCSGVEQCTASIQKLPIAEGNLPRYRKAGWTHGVQEVAGNPWFRTERHTVQPGHGKEVDDWMWTEVPDMINVLVQNELGTYIVYRQEKYAIDGETMAIVGGYVKAGEQPQTAAEREVAEELGRVCAKMRPLGTYVVDANRGFGTLHAFVGEKCGKKKQTGVEIAEADSEDQQQVVWDAAQLQAALLEGKFREVKWSMTIALGLMTLQT